MAPRRNQFGVYEPDEVLRLPRTKSGWRGIDVAEISIANLGDRWIWSADFAMWTGDHAMSFRPLNVRSPSASSRETCIADASAYLRERMADRLAEYPDARAIIAWLDTLQPAQFDLFGVAA